MPFFWKIIKNYQKKLSLQPSTYQQVAKTTNIFAKNLFFSKQKKLNLKFDWKVKMPLFGAATTQKRQQI